MPAEKNLLDRAANMPTVQINKEIDALLTRILDAETPDYVRQELQTEIGLLSQIVLRRKG